VSQTEAAAVTGGTGGQTRRGARSGRGPGGPRRRRRWTLRGAAGGRRLRGAAGGRRLRGNPALTLLAVALGVMMVALDGTIVAVANPAIQAHLGASLADMQWVTNGYLLALAVALITMGKIGDRFGHKKVFLAGIVGFAAASAAVGLSGDIAGSIGLVIAFRVAQGVFGAMLQPTALALLRKNFPAEKLNTALGIWGAVIGASTAAGPIVGGLLVQHVNWEACFYINVPVGLIALAMGWLVLRETGASRSASFDIPGMALLSGALFTLVWALIKGADYGWGSGRTVGFLAGAVVLALLFVLRESRAAEPLLPLRLFRSVSLSAGVVLVMTLMFALLGAMFFMTFFLQNVHGLGAVDAAIRLLPLTGMLIVASPISGALINRLGPRVPLVAGMLLAAVALFGLSRIGLASGLNDTIVWFALLGLGLSPVMVGATDVIVGNAPVRLAGVAGGLQSTAMQVGGTIGTAVLGAIMSARVDSLLPARWAAAHLPSLSGAQLAEVKSATTVGVAPVPHGTPAQAADLMTGVVHGTFISGMNTAFLVASVVALAGALIALLARRGQAVEGGTHAGS
jgi:EmrB/QacA subfamily drug resistance transporter